MPEGTGLPDRQSFEVTGNRVSDTVLVVAIRFTRLATLSAVVGNDFMQQVKRTSDVMLMVTILLRALRHLVSSTGMFNAARSV